MPEDAPMNIGALLAVPDTARRRVLGMQTKLHRWAAADSGRRFDDLYNLVADPAFLVTAWSRVRENKGARSAGIDKRTARSIEDSQRGVDGFLEEVRVQLKARTFRPVPVRRTVIPKANGKLRSLGIPTIADRVVQASLKLVLEPILETDFGPSSYGFRPERRAQDAIEEIRKYAREGYEWVFEGDIAACFDEIDHTALLDRLRRRATDKRVISLVKAFLKAGVLDERGLNRDTNTGTPQGGILSPLLANLALSHLDDYFDARWNAHRNADARMRYRRRGKATYRLVRYADDFVILVNGTRAHAQAQWEEVGDVLSEVGLRLAPEKTQVVHIDEGFDFLGFHIQRHTQKGSNRKLIYSYPSKKSQQAIRRKVKTVTKRITHQSLSELLRQLNSMTRGWSQYFRHGSSSAAYHSLQNYLWWRIWRWLNNKHPRTSKRWIIRHYYDGSIPEHDGVRLYQPTTMTIKRYRYRGSKIPTPWDEPTTATA
ncbi:MAG TPA: group II intron reverse transcriptase/maturase [Pseudonocardiaceae bacterium]|jgi:RNA-directed DNA polymerase|nr:group II intron reverse transcriptase/maturase [Pseudonocardiaceae bacterium]